jgi:hypothetical protein
MGATFGTPTRSLTLMLCHGHKHLFNANLYYSIDMDPSTQPDKVADIRYEHTNIPDFSLDELVFQYCPTYLFQSPSLSQWFRKIKQGGTVRIRGKHYDQQVNVSQTTTKKWISFKKILHKQIRNSGRTFQRVKHPSEIILINKK